MKYFRDTIFIALLLLVSCETSRFVPGRIKSLEGNRISEKETDNFLRHQIDSLQITGLSVAIIENDKIVYYKALGEKNIDTHEKVDSNTLFEAASMTKPVFAFAIHKLVEKKLIDIDTPLYKYFQYKDIEYDNRYKLITGRMVLSHTSGLPNWRPKGGELTINAEPGSTYIYSGEGFEFLGYSVHEKTGIDLQDIILEEVFSPLNIRNSFLIDNEYITENMSTGHTDNKVSGRMIIPQAQVAYGLRTEAKDYAKFVIELMSESHLPGSTFSKMAVPQIAVDQNTFMCLGIFMENTPYGVKYYHGGNNGNRFQSHFAFYKDRNIGFVFFTNCNKGRQLAERFNEFLVNGE